MPHSVAVVWKVSIASFKFHEVAFNTLRFHSAESLESFGSDAITTEFNHVVSFLSEVFHDEFMVEDVTGVKDGVETD
jgi:hypothetical protein